MQKKLLIIDNCRSSRQELLQLLADEYQVLEAENGREAMDILGAQAQDIAAVLLSLTLPGQEGFSILRQIRDSVAIDLLPVMVCADRYVEEWESLALSLGASDFTVKPYKEALRLRLHNIIEATVSIRKLRAEKESLRISEELFRIAATTGERITARYNIKTGVYYRSEKKLTSLDFDDVVENVPQAFIDNKIIAPEAVAEYLSFYDKIRSGHKTCSMDLAILEHGGKHRWFRSDATVIFDDQGQPSQAIIVYIDITEQREKETVYKKWQQSLRQKAPESYTLFRCNLSRDASFDSVEGLLLSIRFQEESATFNERTLEYASQYVHPDDRENYIATLNADALLANYYRDKRMETLEYRETLPDGLTRWLRLTIELVEYPNTSDVEAYLMYEDIDASKSAAMKALEMAENDPLTGVLNRTAFAQRMEQLFQRNRTARHTLLMLDIDGFKLLNDTFGHAVGDQALIDIAKSLRSVLRQGDLLGRLGGDEFLICMKDVPYDAVIEKKARQICSMVRKAYSMEVQISASIGIAVYPRDGEDFDSLYRNADAALYSVKSMGKDNFAYFGGLSDGADAEQPLKVSSTASRRRMLIVDDSEINRAVLAKIFEDDFIIDMAEDGGSALTRLRHYGSGLAVVLLDLIMPGLDGFAVLEKMNASVELRSIPVIVVSGQDDGETSLQAIRCGAADFVTKPVDPDLIRLRVASAISRAENERLRAQNSYLLLQSSEEVKYRTVLDSTGTVVIEYDWVAGVFTYDQSITRHIAGQYGQRKLWRILLSDMVADAIDVRDMQELVHQIANDRSREDGSMLVRLNTPSGLRQWFRMRVFKRADEFQLTDKMIITFVNVNDEITAQERLRFQAERDDLTGLYNRTTFFEKAAAMVSSHRPGFYVMACFDINNFKVVNDQYGSAKGDEMLRQVAAIFQSGFSAVGGLTCRITADNFAVLYPASFMNSQRLADIRKAASGLDGSIPPISFSIGRYKVDDLSLSVSAMYDRAVLAEASVKGRFDANIAQYDESMRLRLLYEQEIVNEMKQALENRQFQLWFQPQYNHSSGALIGAEAVVRWHHPTKGVTPPGSFIPVFERNGFIYELDKYVWEQTCFLLRRWLDAGLSPLPVSVNISRYDLFREDLAATILDLTAKYDIAIDLLRLEITESAFANSTEQIVSVVKCLIDHGFTVEIDDFGSGYSSLNTLKDVPAQVLKMDMRFLESNDNSDRGGNILESVVRMAKWLGMAVIAEGVETKIQADYLKSIGCNYVQGYLYARPLPLAQYEDLMADVTKEEALLTMETVENLDNNSFWDPKSMDTLIFNTYVGGACIFEWHNNRIEVLRANEKYAQTIGGPGCTVDDALNLVWEEHMDADAALATRQAIERTIESGDDATYEAVYHNLFGNGKRTWLRTTFRAIARTDARYLLYATNENLTAQREAEQNELEMFERLQTIMDNVGSGITAAIIHEEQVEYLFVNDRFYEILGYTKAQYESEVPNIFNLTHPEDREIMADAVTRANEIGKSTSAEYRVTRRDGQEIWIRVIISARRFEGIDQPVQFSVCTDITAEKQAEDKLRQNAEQLHFLNNTAGDLLGQPDALQGVSIVLQKVLDYFGADRSFIYEYGYEDETCTNSYEKYAPQVKPYTSLGESLPLSVSHYWLQTFEGSDFFRYDQSQAGDIELWPTGSLYGRPGAASILAVALRCDGRIIGAMGVDNPTRHLGDYSNLKALGDYMSVILTRRDLTAKIESDRENLQNMMNDTPGGFARLRVLEDGCLATEYVNEAYCRLRGQSRQELLAAEGRDALIAVHPDDAELVRTTVAELIASGQTRSIQYRLRHGDGSYLPFTVFGRVSRNEDGDTFINSYYADMSEREKRELSVRETLPFILSAIMKSATDSTFAKDKDFRYICCSPAFLRLAGLEQESQVIGRDDFELFDKETAEIFRSSDLRLLEGGEPLIDFMEPTPSDDGVQHYSRTSKYILRDAMGTAIGIYGVGRDVTAERTAFEQLRLLTDSIPGGIASYAVTPEGAHITYFNDGFCHMLGYSRDEYEKTSASGITNITFKEDVPLLMDQIKALVNHNRPLNCTYRIHCKNGGFKWVNLRSNTAERRGDVCTVHTVLYDVTEQKQAQEEARIHQLEMQTAMSQLGKMICEYDPLSHTLTVPAAYAALYNLPPEISDVPDSLIAAQVIDPETLPAYRGFYEAILRGEAGGFAEYRDRSADGSWHWERTEFYNIFDSAGRPVKTVIAVEETTQQHLQYELEQSRPTLGEENLLVHALFNLNTGETLDYAYADGSEVPPGERTAFIYGGDNLEQIIINEEERESYRRLNDPEQLLALYQQGENELSIDYRRRLPGGRIIWVRNLLHMVRQPGGSDILLFEYCYNIEAEKTQELISSSLVKQNFEFITIINGTDGSYATISGENASFAQPTQSGADLDAAVRELTEKQVHPEDRETVLRNALLAGVHANLAETNLYQFAYRELAEDGSVRSKKVKQYFLDRDRDIIITLREDVTQLKEDEQRKNKLLENALASANQASQAKSEFLSRMSHELRTPMNAIIGLSALSASEVNDPKAMEDSIAKIGMSARYLLSLINDILEMSRIESGRMTLSEAPFDFQQLITEVNGVVYTQAEAAGLDYDAIVSGYTEPSYVGDVTKLQQILVNVLGNAVKFTPRGGKVTLAIEQVRRTKKRATLRFTVTDTGIGMDEDFLPQMFDPFSQERADFTYTAGGTGLGLAITKNLVDMMDGHISVKSIKNVGSVFTIDVQLGIAKELQRQPNPAAAMKLDKLRALVVDDDVIVCRSTQATLKTIGIQADWAESGQLALEKVQERHQAGQDFDAIFIDWKMPDMDGLETTRRIRKIVGPEATIIIMTAYDWKTIEAEALEAGADMFMDKPLFQSSIVKAFEKAFMSSHDRPDSEPPAPPSFTGKRFLLAEDHPLNLEVATRLLEKVGAEVVAAHTGLEALESFATEPEGYFDAILMDIRMPVMDGLTACRAIRNLRKKGSRNIPIIAMTANAFDEDVELSLAHGMNAHLAKPIEPHTLYYTLSKLLK